MADFLPCSARKPLTQFQKDGTKRRVQRCWEQTADKFNQDVKPSDCEACPVREEITRRAMRETGYTPPMVAEIRQVYSSRKDTEPLAGWEPCTERNVVTIGGCCNQRSELRVCDCVSCFRLGSEVSKHICQQCPDRKPPG